MSDLILDALASSLAVAVDEWRATGGCDPDAFVAGYCAAVVSLMPQFTASDLVPVIRAETYRRAGV